MIPEEVIKYFKRNPEAKAAHLVLTNVFDDLATATRYQKAVYAKMVSSFLREEVASEVASASPRNDGEVASEVASAKPRNDRNDDKKIKLI